MPRRGRHGERDCWSINKLRKEGKCSSRSEGEKKSSTTTDLNGPNSLGGKKKKMSLLLWRPSCWSKKSHSENGRSHMVVWIGGGRKKKGGADKQ